MKKVLIFIGVLLVLGIIFVVVGIVSSNRLVVDNQVIEYDDLQGLKIAHFSDSHLINERSYKLLEETVKKINDENIDLVFFTGDLFEVENPTEDDIAEVVRILLLLECENIFAVNGNHDLLGDSKSDIVKDIFLKSNIELLVNSNYIYEYNEIEINIIGLDDYMMGNINYDTALETSIDNDYNIVLSHEPDTFDIIKDYNIISVFSGHSHGGQVRLPVIGEIYNIVGAKIYNEHHYYLNETHLFVNFGLGATIIPVRFYNPAVLDIYIFN